MNKKKLLLGIIAIVCVVVLVVILCTSGNDTPDSATSSSTPIGNEQVDEDRTQLFVYNFNGGYGSDWLIAAKERFEAEHENDVWEEGKKGVQIMIDPKKEAIMDISSQILGRKPEVYFTEKAYLYTLRDMGVLADITDAVTTPLSEYGETESIADKMTDEQRAYWGIKEGEQVKYYGIPHYAGYFGLNYNVDLFNNQGYYFAANPADSSLEGQFISKYNTVKSDGPDGVMGTSDDGLPRTYAEFFRLCEYIRLDGNTPVIWGGAVYKSYLTALIHSLYVDYEGLDQTMLNFTLDGVASTLATVKDSKMILDEVATTITVENGYELTRQAGRYYALEFVDQLIDQIDARLNCFNTIHYHTTAQEDFLWAGHDGQTSPVAMLVDGIWWESEASETFRLMSDRMGSEYAKANRNFAFMPLPKATQEKYQENVNNGANASKTTLIDHIYSICFVKSNIAEWKKPLALEFIRFVNTDVSLAEFTMVTNTIKAFDYPMTSDQLSNVTTYGRSLFDIKSRASIVYPYAQTSTYINNQNFFDTEQQFFSTVKEQDVAHPAEAMREKGASALDIFEGMYSYYKKTWNLK